MHAPACPGKLDQIGVPNFEAGAMENAGAITFREVALLLDVATAPLAVPAPGRREAERGASRPREAAPR